MPSEAVCRYDPTQYALPRFHSSPIALSLGCSTTRTRRPRITVSMTARTALGVLTPDVAQPDDTDDRFNDLIRVIRCLWTIFYAVRSLMCSFATQTFGTAGSVISGTRPFCHPDLTLVTEDA